MTMDFDDYIIDVVTSNPGYSSSQVCSSLYPNYNTTDKTSAITIYARVNKHLAALVRYGILTREASTRGRLYYQYYLAE